MKQKTCNTLRLGIKKIILNIAIFSFVAIPILGFVGAHNALADADALLWGGQLASVTTEIGLKERDPRAIIAAVINVVLGFLGIIAVLIILSGGFKYMTAGGAEDQVDEAKKLMVSGAIGLVIILASFGLAAFVMGALMEATGNA